MDQLPATSMNMCFHVGVDRRAVVQDTRCPEVPWTVPLLPFCTSDMSHSSFLIEFGDLLLALLIRVASVTILNYLQ